MDRFAKGAVPAAPSAAHVPPEVDFAALPEAVREVLYETALKKTYNAARFAPRSVDDLHVLAEEWYDSDLLPEAYYPDWEDKQGRPIKYTNDELRRLRKRGISRAKIVMRYGAALGVLPELSIRLIYIIDGQPSPAAALMLAIFLSSPVCAVFEPLESTAQKARMKVGRRGQKPFDVEATHGEYKHLHGRKNWANYPTDMVYARCLGRAMRRVAPDLFAGVYCAEERVDFEAERGHAAPDGVLERILELADIEERAPVRRIAQEEMPPAEVGERAAGEAREVANVAPAKTEPTRAEWKELYDQIANASDSILPEQVDAMRADLARFDDAHGRGKLLEAWKANGTLGAPEVAS
jgi:hypothetical protein